jgi:hypothetical protein
MSMSTTSRFLHAIGVAAPLLLSSLLIACGGAALSEHGIDAPGSGSAGTTGAGGMVGPDGAAGGTSGTGGSVGAGGSAATGGASGTGGSVGAGGSAATGGRQGSGGRSGAGGSSSSARDAGGDGRTFRDVGPALDGPAVGGACGGPGDPPCAEGTYCDFPDNRCGTGVPGACATIPRGVLCAIAPAPVCGCDGKNYPGECQARQASADVSSTATCAPPAGMFRCGWSYCQEGAEYCSAQVGGAVTNPGSYTCKALPAACNGVASCDCVVGTGPLCSTSAQGDVTVTLAVP